MRMDSLIAQFDPETGTWGKIQIPYSWPDFDVASGVLRIRAVQDGVCIREYVNNWAYAECLLPDPSRDELAMQRGGTTVVQFLEPRTQQSFMVWADNVEVEFEQGRHPTLFDPRTGYGVMFFAHPLEIFEHDAIGPALHRRVMPSALEP